ncbi:hypothetical protein GGR54DRAFT_484609 [Hypoxylon sp. NC1633]|nr:hypothetical protein GGR54DRAFT_484609 [Hypoxylon sp. NC1633]
METQWVEDMEPSSKQAPPFSVRLLEGTAYDKPNAPEPTNSHLRSLLPASYRIEDNLTRPKLDDLTFLEKELGVGRLYTLVDWLWVAGRPMPPHALHGQLLLGRNVVIAEQMDLHLVWAPDRILLKPLPSFLLEPRFWRDHLACKLHCDCSPDSGEGASIRECPRRKLWRCALGFLFSYAGLICYESDFLIAKEKLLLPRQIEWVAWRAFIEELDTEHIYGKIDRRFLYGELRLRRLNILYRLSQGIPQHGYLPHWKLYGDFLQDNFQWLASATIYIAIVLTAMQVGLATEALAEDQSFQLASYGFTVFSIIVPLAVGGLIVLGFCIIFVYNFAVTIAYKNKRFRSFQDNSGRLSKC